MSRLKSLLERTRRIYELKKAQILKSPQNLKAQDLNGLGFITFVFDIFVLSFVFYGSQVIKDILSISRQVMMVCVLYHQRATV